MTDTYSTQLPVGSPPGDGSPNTIADTFRKLARFSGAVLSNPVGTYLPLARPVSTLVKELPAYVSDLAPRNNNAQGNSYFTASNPRTDPPSPARGLSASEMLQRALIPGWAVAKDSGFVP